MANKRSVQRGSRRQKDLVWVSSLTSVLINSASATSFATVIPADWARNVNSGERATVLRIRGDLSWAQRDGAPAVGQANYGAMISIGDTDATGTGNWLANIALLEPEAPMWTKVWVTSNTADAQVGTQAGARHEIDVKAKRKITSGQLVDLSLAAALISGTFQDYELTVFLRVLLKIS